MTFKEQAKELIKSKGICFDNSILKCTGCICNPSLVNEGCSPKRSLKIVNIYLDNLLLKKIKKLIYK